MHLYTSALACTCVDIDRSVRRPYISVKLWLALRMPRYARLVRTSWAVYSVFTAWRVSPTIKVRVCRNPALVLKLMAPILYLSMPEMHMHEGSRPDMRRGPRSRARFASPRDPTLYSGSAYSAQPRRLDTTSHLDVRVSRPTIHLALRQQCGTGPTSRHEARPVRRELPRPPPSRRDRPTVRNLVHAPRRPSAARGRTPAGVFGRWALYYYLPHVTHLPRKAISPWKVSVNFVVRTTE